MKARILPCSTCKEGTAALRDGSDYTMSRSPHSAFPLRVFCARCKRYSVCSVEAWNRLPQEDIEGPVAG